MSLDPEIRQLLEKCDALNLREYFVGTSVNGLTDLGFLDLKTTLRILVSPGGGNPARKRAQLIRIFEELRTKAADKKKNELSPPPPVLPLQVLTPPQEEEEVVEDEEEDVVEVVELEDDEEEDETVEVVEDEGEVEEVRSREGSFVEEDSVLIIGERRPREEPKLCITLRDTDDEEEESREEEEGESREEKEGESREEDDEEETGSLGPLPQTFLGTPPFRPRFNSTTLQCDQ